MLAKHSHCSRSSLCAKHCGTVTVVGHAYVLTKIGIVVCMHA